MRRVFGWLLVLPFVLFALLGQGTMIDAGPAGPRIVLCSGSDVVEMILSADGTLIPAENDRHDHSGDVICDWAVHAQSALTTGPVVAVVPVLLELAADYSLHLPLRLWQTEVPAPAARGPPRLI